MTFRSVPCPNPVRYAGGRSFHIDIFCLRLFLLCNVSSSMRRILSWYHSSYPSASYGSLIFLTIGATVPYFDTIFQLRLRQEFLSGLIEDA